MDINIGANIKRFRLLKGYTQEQLASLLSVSSAAVSKWEAKNTYPDIGLLFPLAQIFGVSIDELLGYDEAKEKENIEEIVSEYNQTHIHGDFEKASKIIKNARAEYPHDYRIMCLYMQDIAGGTAGNDADTLLRHQNEIEQICDCILDGCRQDGIRISAINMRAKLFHAQGNTAKAFEVLDFLPVAEARSAKERLFKKDTAEYRYWNKVNLYAMLDGTAIKLARTVRFDPEKTNAEKVKRLEELGGEFEKISDTVECFCVAEQAVYAVAAGTLTADDNIDDIIRLRKKQFSAMRKMMKITKEDDALRECVISTYKTDDLVGWVINRLLHSPHPQFSALRENEKYMEMLKEQK